MGNWWVPGLNIGYEHTFIHQVADFLKSLESGEAAIEPSFRTAQVTQKCATQFWPAQATALGSWSESRR